MFRTLYTLNIHCTSVLNLLVIHTLLALPGVGEDDSIAFHSTLRCGHIVLPVPVVAATHTNNPWV
jgi:hypothetical protein